MQRLNVRLYIYHHRICPKTVNRVGRKIKTCYMRKLSIFLVLFSLLLVSCKKDKESPINQPNPAGAEDPLITKARNYFNNSVLQATSSATETLDPRQSLKKTADWDNVYISVTAKKDVVAVPLKFERPMKFRAAGNELALSQQSKLLIYEGPDGKMKAEVVTYIPDQANTQEKFSGIIIVEDWVGNSINRYIYQNNPSNQMNSVQGDCIKIDWYLCDVTESGATYNCEYLYSEWIGNCNQGLEPPGEEYVEIERRKQMMWTVFMPDNSAWFVAAWDKLRGRGGVFTGIIADGSAISWSSPFYWRENSHGGSYQGNVARSTVAGSILTSFNGQTLFNVEEEKPWYYSDVFGN
jgi:hypothetical protein